MYFRKRLHILLIFFSLTSSQIICHAEQQVPKVSIQFEGKDKFVGFKFETAGLKNPLLIKGKAEYEKGGIFFETVNGKKWLRDKCIRSKADKASFHGRWECDDGKIVFVDIISEGDDFVVSFSSAGGARIVRWGFLLEADGDEYFTGLFERVVDGRQAKSWEKGIQAGMNLYGQQVDMHIKPTLSAYAPFYISSRGYGLFVYGSWPGRYDLCKEYSDRLQIQFNGPELKFKIYTSGKPSEIIKRHSIEVGPSILPPRWVFRPWRWRDEHTNRKTYYDGTEVEAPYNSEVVEDILMMEGLDIPCGVYWVDRPWAKGREGYDDFEWDPNRLPSAAEMIKWLNRRGIRFALWIAPWVAGNMARDAFEKNYVLPNQLCCKDYRALIDFTNPEARKWWQEKGVKKVLEQGVAGFKLDRSEEMAPSDKKNYAYDGRSTFEMRNDYPVEYVRSVYEICKEIRGSDFFLFPRAAYTGSSRYGGLWGGDIGSPAEGLRCAIIALQRCAVMGYPIWGSDIGGYWAGKLDREVCARWLAFGCFCPMMEVGPTENRGFWDMKSEPYYDSELLAIWRVYAKLHDALADYSYRCAREARETGMPIARPLFLVYPEQKQAWKDWQTYLYGPDILVSAIWEKGKTKHKLYLPAGGQWVDCWEKKVFEGGEYITVETPLYKIPIFIRQGSDLEMPDLQALYEESLQICRNKPDLKKLEKEAGFEKVK